VWKRLLNINSNYQLAEELKGYSHLRYRQNVQLIFDPTLSPTLNFKKLKKETFELL